MAPIGWFGIIRLGLINAAIGAIFVLATSTLNRVMVVELALPAILPGILVGIQYVAQLTRPRLGYGSDIGGRRTPWIIGGMAAASVGGIGAAVATGWMSSSLPAGIALAVAAFLLIGIGVGAAGTSLLVLLAKCVAPERRPAAASLVWVLMIVGIVVTAGTAGQFLEPFSFGRLIEVVTCASAAAFVVSVLAVWGVEGEIGSDANADASVGDHGFRDALIQVWREPRARNFAVFVFLSMLGYSAQELILEPFAGAVFHMSPAESAKLTGLQNGGALLGMILIGLLGTSIGRSWLGSVRRWTVGACIASALALSALALAGFVGSAWPLRPNVFLLGMANGAFAVSAIGAMIDLAGEGRRAREGVRMGLWGAAQAIAFAVGGLLATLGSDLAHAVLGSSVAAYAAVFVCEALLFLVAARLGARLLLVRDTRDTVSLPGAILAGHG